MILSVVYGKYNASTGFSTRVKQIRALLDALVFPSDWLYLEHDLTEEIVKKKYNDSEEVFIPSRRSFPGLIYQCAQVRWGKWLFDSREKHSYNVILAHSFNSLFSALALKSRIKAPVLLDVHGLWAEEVISKRKNALLASLLKKIEKTIYKQIDGCLFVSNALKDYLWDKYPFLRNKHSAIIPYGFEPSQFEFQINARQKLRSQWGWEECVIIVHSGIFAPWVDIQGIIHFIKLCLACAPQVRFLFLSHDIQPWLTIIEQFHLKDIVKILSVNHPDMAAYLSAADIGLVARIKSPINSVASPTKLAEYLAIGLPVLMTSGIGDYDRYLNENALGTIVSDLLSLTRDNIQPIINKLLSLERSAIEGWARANLNTFNYMEDLRLLFDAIFKKSPVV